MAPPISKLAMATRRPMVREVGDNFLLQNSCLKELSLPEIITINSHFCFHGKNIEKLYLPNVKTIGEHFLTYKQGVATIEVSFNTKGREQISSLIERLRQIENVIEIQRTTG